MSIQINGTSGISGVDGTAGTPALQGSDTNTGISFGTDTVNINTGGTTRATVDSSGRVLVGTSTSPSSGDGTAARIFIAGYTGAPTSGAYMSLAKGTAASSIVSGDELGNLNFTDIAGNVFAVVRATAGANAGTNDYPGCLHFSTTADGASSPTERMRINKSGFIKASNTTSYIDADGSWHEVNSSANDEWALRVRSVANSGAQYGIELRTGNDQNDATRMFLQCIGGATHRASIRSNGGLANYSANNANLSDRNAKKDISLAAGTWDCIKEWEIVNYRYKDQPDDAELNLGVIAQQVAESCPEVITVFEEAKGDQPEKLGIKEQQMYWMAIKALQEAQVRIEALEAEVAALKAQ